MQEGKVPKEGEAGKDQARSITGALMLAIAYAASVGGTATLVGTPPNIILVGQFTSLFPEQPPIGFLQWMLVALPVAIGFLIIIAVVLSRFPGALLLGIGCGSSIIVQQNALVMVYFSIPTQTN